MKDIINKIKNLSLEEINKNLILVALLVLIYRMGNFYNTFIPKPFEIIVLLIVLLAIVDALKNNKLKEFFFAIPRDIRIAFICLIFSVLIGWGASLLKGIPTTFNTILEFGTFMFSLSIFLLILIYTRNDKNYIKIYFYALLLPAVYAVFIFLPKIAYYLHLGNAGTFLGLTMNPNIISKILLIPAMLFFSFSLFKSDKKWVRLGHIALAVAVVSLLFWVASRGGLIALALGSLFVWLVFALHHFNWKKLLISGILIFTILVVGFALTPDTGKQRVVLRILYPSGSDYSDYVDVQDKSTRNVISKFISEKSGSPIFIYSERETRFQIWPFYLKQVLINPLGIGPNTHLSFSLTDNNGEYINSGPHNTFLQIWLWGGLLGIFSFLYIFFSAFKNLAVKLKADFNPEALAMLGALFAVSVSIMFDDSLSFFWFFIILALALKYENARS
ncbi:MAG: O-antigen ligase family protein [Patescibacteria group bacterium]